MAAQNASSATAVSPLWGTAQSCMSSPVRTVFATQTIADAQTYLRRYGHTALCVVDSSGALMGIISHRDVEVAIRHGLGPSPAVTCMRAPAKTIEPKTPLPVIQALMVDYDLGCLPVVLEAVLVGIVTRSDLLRQLTIMMRQAPLLSESLLALSSRSAISDRIVSPVPSVDVLYSQLKARIAAVWPALMLIVNAAKEKDWAVYLVGGAVRDLLLNCLGQSHPLTDIDLVVDGAEPGAGATLAEIIEATYPQVVAQVYGEFQTATLTWPMANNDGSTHSESSHSEASKDSSSVTVADFSIDIVTARTEYYAYPTANPEVDVSTIHQDLYRRDFTVNALALRLEPESIDEFDSLEDSSDLSTRQLLDFFGGWADLQCGCMRVIHPNSFIEDPTRIFRAVRFSMRLGFSIEAYTRQLIRYAVQSGVYAIAQASDRKTPALQSRLTTELKSVLSSDQWAVSLAELDRLGALVCIHPELTISPVLWRQLRRMARWQPKFANDQPLWLLLLSLLIAQLPAAESEPCSEGLRQRVATTLNLDPTSQQRLKKLHCQETDLLQQLPQAQYPSHIFNCLRSYGQFELLLIAARHPYPLGTHIWHYIVHLSRMPPLINGATLKRLGYRPGPQFREILSAVHQRTLDGDLYTAQSAEDYVLSTYPRGDD